MSKIKTLALAAAVASGWAAWHYAPGHAKATVQGRVRVAALRAYSAVADRLYPWRPARLADLAHEPLPQDPA